MSTTVKAAPLTYTFTENINFTGEERGSSISKQIDSGIMEYSRVVRRINTTNFMAVAEFASTPLDSGSQFDLEEVKYIRVTNLDTNHVLAIAFKPTIGATMTLAINPGHTFMMGSPQAAFADSETVPFRDLQEIGLRAINSHVDAEIVVGSH